jgi:hypothetical protein
MSLLSDERYKDKKAVRLDGQPLVALMDGCFDVWLLA